MAGIHATGVLLDTLGLVAGGRDDRRLRDQGGHGAPILMGMRNRLIALGVVASAIAGLSFASSAEAQKRVLYLDHVGPGAHDHPSRVNARAAMTAIAQSSNGLFTIDLRTDPTGLDAAALAPYDAVVFFTCGDLPADHPLRPALFAFVAGGKGFVGFHSATDSFYSWPEYGDFIGARFINHGSDNRPGIIRVDDPNHVAMQGFSNPFTFTEEFYLFRGPSFTSVDSFTRRDLHVLMDLDPATPSPRARCRSRGSRSSRRPTFRSPGRGSMAPAACSIRTSATGRRPGTTRSSAPTPPPRSAGRCSTATPTA